MPEVTCGGCGHPAEISAPADVWKCSCAAQDSRCNCDELNEAFGSEDNPPDKGGEIADLEARLQQLRGHAAAEGTPNV